MFGSGNGRAGKRNGSLKWEYIQIHISLHIPVVHTFSVHRDEKNTNTNKKYTHTASGSSGSLSLTSQWGDFRVIA